jgi:RimJ/RimL family protein N-acetyltransferase
LLLKWKRAGYLLINRKNDFNLITEVILPKHRNAGIASALVNIVKQNYLPLKAEIYTSNKASIKLHLKCGFKKIHSNGLFEEYEFRG